MTEDENARQQPAERVRDEVYGMRTEEIIEGADQAAPQPPASERRTRSSGPVRPGWTSIEDQMANPTPGKQQPRRSRRP